MRHDGTRPATAAGTGADHLNVLAGVERCERRRCGSQDRRSQVHGAVRPQDTIGLRAERGYTDVELGLGDWGHGQP